MSEIFGNMVDFRRALRLPVAAEHREQNLAIGGRYLSHFEDAPMVWQKAWDSPTDAVQAMQQLIAQRLACNGAGCGAVLDIITDSIIAVAEVPMPDDVEGFNMALVIRRSDGF
jgi:hypothetical protein